MARKDPPDPTDAPSVPPPFKNAEADEEEDSLLSLPPPDLPTLIPTDDTVPPQPPPLTIPRPSPAPAPPPEPRRGSLASRAKRPVSVAEALKAAGNRPREVAGDSRKIQAVEVAVLHAIADLFPGASVIRLAPVADRKVFKALWQAHRARAQADANHPLAVAASVLLDASSRVPKNRLYAAEIALDGTQQALWVDAERGTILALADPTYLAGV